MSRPDERPEDPQGHGLELEALKPHSSLEAAVEQAHETIMLTDRAGRIQYVNPSFERTTGYTREEVVGQTPRLLKSGLEQDAFYRELWETIERGEVWSNCIFNKKKDGTLFVEQMTISPIRDEASDIVSYLAVKRDVTRERALKFQLQQAQKIGSIGQLTAGIAHEINTPIQFIGDYTRFLGESFETLLNLLSEYENLRDAARTGATPTALIEKIEDLLDEAELDFLSEQIPKAVEGSLGGVERIATIARAMKELSQPPSEEKTHVDLNHILENTITIARNRWKYVSEVVTDFEHELPGISCHPAELKEVFLNLIVNAAEAIERARGEDSENLGAIGIRTRSDESWVEVRISDTGTGMPKAIGARIFEPYFTTKEDQEEAGQGLAIVHSFVVERHQGSISFETAPGRGTTFTLRLPIGSA